MAEGSHATFDGYPRTCTVCGKPIRITGLDSLRFEWHPKLGRRSWHIRCLDLNRCYATEALARCTLEQGHTAPHRWEDIP